MYFHILLVFILLSKHGCSKEIITSINIYTNWLLNVLHFYDKTSKSSSLHTTLQPWDEPVGSANSLLRSPPWLHCLKYYWIFICLSLKYHQGIIKLVPSESVYVIKHPLVVWYLLLITSFRIFEWQFGCCCLNLSVNNIWLCNNNCSFLVFG